MLPFDKPMLRALAAEFLCTFIFIFTICSQGLHPWGAASSAIATSLVAVAIIYAFGGLSGAHFNPAVTVGAMVGGKIDPIKGAMYIVLQLAAALLAVLALMGFYPSLSVAPDLVLKPPSVTSLPAAIGMEFLLSFILVLVIYCTAMGVRTTPSSQDVESQEETTELIASNRQRMNFAPIAIGFTLGFLCFLGGDISGGAFNPARATAPALLALDLGNVWIYWVGDVLGGAAAAGLYMSVFS